MSRDETTLLDIDRAAHLVIEFKQGMDKETFLKDIKTQSAILHQLMVIGEAVKRLSQDFRTRYPELPWELMQACVINLFMDTTLLTWTKSGKQRMRMCQTCSHLSNHCYQRKNSRDRKYLAPRTT